MSVMNVAPLNHRVSTAAIPHAEVMDPLYSYDSSCIIYLKNSIRILDCISNTTNWQLFVLITKRFCNMLYIVSVVNLPCPIRPTLLLVHLRYLGSLSTLSYWFLWSIIHAE